MPIEYPVLEVFSIPYLSKTFQNAWATSSAVFPALTRSIAVSAITIYQGNEFKNWNGHALVTSLKDQSLRKLVFDDLSNIKEEIIFKDKIGRIRDIQIHPNNGKIYFLAGENLWLMERK